MTRRLAALLPALLLALAVVAQAQPQPAAKTLEDFYGDYFLLGQEVHREQVNIEKTLADNKLMDPKDTSLDLLTLIAQELRLSVASALDVVFLYNQVGAPGTKVLADRYSLDRLKGLRDDVALQQIKFGNFVLRLQSTSGYPAVALPTVQKHKEMAGKFLAITDALVSSIQKRLVPQPLDGQKN